MITLREPQYEFIWKLRWRSWDNLCSHDWQFRTRHIVKTKNIETHNVCDVIEQAINRLSDD